MLWSFVELRTLLRFRDGLRLDGGYRPSMTSWVAPSSRPGVVRLGRHGRCALQPGKRIVRIPAVIVAHSHLHPRQAVTRWARIGW